METARHDDKQARIDHFSHSSFKCFRGCPGSWHEHYFAGDMPEGEPDVFLFGRVIHDLTAMYDRHCYQVKAETDPAAAEKIFNSGMGAYPEAEAQRRELRAVYDRYVGSHMMDHRRLAGVELDIETPFPEEFGEIMMQGRLDRVFFYPDTNRITIRDLKSDGAIRSQADVDRDEQLSTYATIFAEAKHWPGEIDVELDFIRYGKTRRSVRTQEDMAQTREGWYNMANDILERLGRLAAGSPLETEFPFKIGAACATCGFSQSCPEVKAHAEQQGELFIANPGDAVYAAMMMIATAERFGQLKELLQSYCCDHGNIILNGMDVGYHLTESYDYPVAAVAGILEAHGEEALVYMNVSATAIKKAAKRDPELAAAIERVRTDASHTTFAARKAKGGEGQ